MVACRSVVPPPHEHFKGQRESMNTLKPYTDDLEKQLNSHASLLTKKQHDINGLYDRRAGVVEEIRVLVQLDASQGVHRKLKNRWGSILHTVV